MDAVEYIKADKRLCRSYESCIGCPLANGLCDPNNDPEEHVAIVEAWAKEHQLTTNFKKFVEVFGHSSFAEIKESGVDLAASWWNKEYKNPND